MNSPRPETPTPQVQLRGPRSSSVIVHRVAPGSGDAFLEWQRGVTGAAEGFAGYQATEVYPPTADRPHEWVVVIHFDTLENLQGWLDSPQRAEWTAKLPREFGDFRLWRMPSGFAPWFAGAAEAGAELPHWKVFLMVLLGLYPTVMVLTLYLSPHTDRFGLAVSILIGNIASCAFLEWLGSPVIRLLLGPWLRASGAEGRVRNLAGTLLIVGALAAMAALFHLIGG
jgi:antibiotic biosynthesis monooxygenase (ABM) superfamily enzyme